jgi:hypothetical protein
MVHSPIMFKILCFHVQITLLRSNQWPTNSSLCPKNTANSIAQHSSAVSFVECWTLLSLYEFFLARVHEWWLSAVTFMCVVVNRTVRWWRIGHPTRRQCILSSLSPKSSLVISVCRNSVQNHLNQTTQYAQTFIHECSQHNRCSTTSMELMKNKVFMSCCRHVGLLWWKEKWKFIRW